MSCNKTYMLVGLGEILWDVLPEGKKLGGAPANFAYHAQTLGGRGVVVSCIGDDNLGREITERLENLGLERSYIAVDKEHPTGTVTVELDEKGAPNFTIHEDVAWDFIPTTPQLLQLASVVDAVCFGSLCQRSYVSRRTVRDFLQATKPDCLRICDINIRQSFYNKVIVDDMLRLSNICKLNNNELPVVAKVLDLAGSETDVLSMLTERYSLKLVVLTKGEKGSRLYSADNNSEHEGFAPEHIADTVGAGDAFTAAVALGLILGKDLDEINQHANRVASFVCSQSGATPKIPDSFVVIN
ncbi:carbohydrate kinase [Planctomycetota bacterium]